MPSMITWMVPGFFLWYPFAIGVFALLSSLGVSTKTGSSESDLRGKLAIVTGANTGIGKSTAAALAANGATVIIACRSVERGLEAKRDIEDELRTCSTSGTSKLLLEQRTYPYAEHGAVHVRELDLSDLESVETFVKGYLAEFKRLEILINNAGLNGASAGRVATKQGFDMVWGTNYIGHFHLTYLLLDTLKAAPSARIVNLGSVMHHFARGDVLQAAVGNFQGESSYSYSKLAAILSSAHLRRLLAGTNVTAIATNPGFVRSDIWRSLNAHPTWGKAWLAVQNLFALSPAQGAFPSVVAATQDFTDSPLYLVPYYVPSWAWLPFEMVGPFAGPRPITPRLPEGEPEVSRKLWDISLSLCSRKA